MAKAKKKSPIRRGSDHIKKQDNKFVAIEPESTAEIVPLYGMNELLSIEQHAIWLDAGRSPIFVCLEGTGEICPGCQLGEDSRFRAFLPVMVKGETEPKIYAFPVSVARQLDELEDEYGTIKGQRIRIRRSGAGLNTRYMVIATGKTMDVDDAEVPDIEAELGPLDRKGILELLVSRGIDISAILLKSDPEIDVPVDADVEGEDDEPEPEDVDTETDEDEEAGSDDWDDDWDDD